MANHPDFLVYFALPHVTEPGQHPSFQHLLDPQCIAAQRAQLEIFLSMLPRSDRQPRLYAMLQADASNRHTNREGSKQTTTAAAHKDLQSLLKGDAELEEFVRTPEEKVATKNAAEAPKNPPFENVELATAACVHPPESCGASTRGVVSGKEFHSAIAPPLSSRAEAEHPGAGGVARQPVQSHNDTASEDTVVARNSGEHGTAPQDASELFPPVPSTQDGHVGVGQEEADTELAAAEGADTLTEYSTTSPQQNQAADTADHSQEPSSPNVPGNQNISPAGDPTGVAVPESRTGEKGEAVQSSPNSTAANLTLSASLDLTQASHRQHGVPCVMTSRNESITRTSLQQSLLPVIDWVMVKEHLSSRDNGHRTRLLQVWCVAVNYIEFMHLPSNCIA